MEDLIIIRRSEWESTLSRMLDEKLKPLLTPPLADGDFLYLCTTAPAAVRARACAKVMGWEE
jgi:hypothetical protein